MNLQTARAQSPQGCALLLLDAETVCIVVDADSIRLYEEPGRVFRRIEQEELGEMRDFADRRFPDTRADESIRWLSLGSLDATHIPQWVREVLRAEREE